MSGTAFEEHFIQKYFRDLRTLILHPVTFFKENPVDEGLTRPLTFALVSHWIASAIRYLLANVGGTNGAATLDRWMKMMGGNEQIQMLSRNSQWNEISNQLSSWLWGMGSVIADPFSTLFWILFSSVFIFVGARILVGTMPRPDGSRAEVSYASAVHIVSFSTAAYIVTIVPYLGPLFYLFYGFYVLYIGVREIYRTTPGRALAVALFPQILVLLFILAGVALLFGAVFKLLMGS